VLLTTRAVAWRVWSSGKINRTTSTTTTSDATRTIWRQSRTSQTLDVPERRAAERRRTETVLGRERGAVVYYMTLPECVVRRRVTSSIDSCTTIVWLILDEIN